MPGWHDATRKLQEEGRLELVGIIQEQHPDRARLFMQWKEMRWPILWDPINATGVKAVPLVWAVDENGIVRAEKPEPSTIEETFVRQTFPLEPRGETVTPPSLEALAAGAASSQGARAYGDALLLYKGDLERAIEAYRAAVELDPAEGRNHFRLGVALRARFDSGAARGDDLQEAVKEWTAAVECDPNHYIYRRRIQQYGPRLQKPYPFYDWVEEARREIAARGEEPFPLRVEPRGSEIASPTKTLEAGAAIAPPDPDRHVYSDPGPQGRFVEVETAAVPAAVKPGEPLRLHLLYRPNRESHWNNEAEPLRVFLDVPSGFRSDAGVHEAELPKAATSDERRTVEFEIVVPEGATPGATKVTASAFYYVCESGSGACLFRRNDTVIPFEVKR